MHMNKYDFVQTRERNKTLFIVEGEREKNELLSLICECFPEMNIKQANILIYGTNIYQLHSRITKEYGEQWSETDVDLAFVVSKMKSLDEVWYKDNFTNIFLIFDYERQDPNFSDSIINRMQAYFIDETDNGKLYINYPMIESYFDSFDSSDRSFKEKKVPLPFQNGKEYKKYAEGSELATVVTLPKRLSDILNKKYNIESNFICEECVKQILSLSNYKTVLQDIETILSTYLEGGAVRTAANLVYDKIMHTAYLSQNCTYTEFMRKELSKIIFRNIRKANYIQNGNYDILDDELKEKFYQLNFSDILNKQNKAGRSRKNAFVWVLNTSVLIVPDYSLTLITLDDCN